jgi:hypothetical protein
MKKRSIKITAATYLLEDMVELLGVDPNTSMIEARQAFAPLENGEVRVIYKTLKGKQVVMKSVASYIRKGVAK